MKICGTAWWENLTVNQLHEMKVEEMQASNEDVMDYLLQVAPLLSTDNKMEFVKLFYPQWLTETPSLPEPVHRPDDCLNCGQECVVCAETNTVTCTNCGLVNTTTFLGNDQANMSFDQIARLDRKSPHLYDRLVHFRNYVRRLMAEETLSLPAAHVQSLRAILAGYPSIDPRTVELAAKKIKLSKIYSSHTVQLAKILGKYKPVQLTGVDVYNLLQAFRRISRWWHYHRKDVAPERKSFLSYSVVFYQLAMNLGHPEWTHDVKLPRHTRTLWKQISIWEKMCTPLQMKTFAPK